MSNDTFAALDVGECRLTHVQPFSTDVHLLFLECKQSAWLILIVFFTISIKLGQNWIFTKMGQLQRELLQMPATKREVCTPKVLKLLGYEFVAGVIGIASIIVITGSNALIWATIIVSNLVGVAFSYTNLEADHHSTALEMINMLENYPDYTCLKYADEEAKRTHEAITKLRKVLARNKEENTNEKYSENYRDAPALKNLIL